MIFFWNGEKKGRVKARELMGQGENNSIKREGKEEKRN